jgi:hypothetical protein
MPTQKPLRELVPAIVQHIRNHIDYMSYNNRLFLVHEGQLRKEIEDSLRKELSSKAYEKAIQRVPSINLLQRIIDKLSRVYSEPVTRDTVNADDKELIEFYEVEASFNERMTSANRIYNLHKAVAIEPFVQDGCPQIRILPAHQFLVFSDDPINPIRPTVFIKFMGTDRSVPYTDANGRKTIVDEVREVQKYYLYSDDEFLVIDSEGQARDDRMQDLGQTGVNPVGRIPFVYVNRSDFRLIPVPDTDTLENTILIPKLLADLNYAVQFQSHSILVATDLDLPADMALAPDTVWGLKSTDETRQGRVDAIKPTVDIEQVIMLIKTTLSIWLEARNIKAGEMGQQAPGDAASGVARIIDEADATQDRQAQAQRFLDAERNLWELLRELHNYWVDAGLLEEKPSKFTDGFEVSIRFGDQKPVVNDMEKIQTAALYLQNRLMTRRQAVRYLNPTMSDEQVDQWVADLEAEYTKNAPEQQSGLPTPVNPKANQGQNNP